MRVPPLTRLPVIVGFGGINAAGRASFNHAYRRLVIETLDERARAETYRNLATLMNLSGDPDAAATRAHIDAHTLIRRIEHFDGRKLLVETDVKEHESIMISKAKASEFLAWMENH